MTYKQVIHKVACPTCGAERGKVCAAGSGRKRAEAHIEREQRANPSGSFLNDLLARFKRFKKSA